MKKKSLIGWTPVDEFKPDVWWDWGQIEIPVIYETKREAKRNGHYVEKVRITIEQLSSKGE